MASVRIGGREVPLRAGNAIVYFSGGAAGPEQAGTYEFWTAVKKGALPVVLRCREGEDLAARFGRTETDAEWTAAYGADYLRPSTKKEIQVWLTRHPKDAPHAGWPTVLRSTR